MVVDLFLVYSFIRRLVTPFNKWDAYKKGIIDDKGNILRKRKSLVAASDKKAFGIFDQLILNLKKLLGKLPGGQTKLASYAAALWLIKEYNEFSDGESLLTEDISDSELDKSLDSFYERYLYYITVEEDVNSLFEKRFIKDEESTNVGSGAIAGLGVGPDGEPGLTKDQQKKHKKRNLKRFKQLIKGENDES